MTGHNIGFKGVVCKIIPKLSLLLLLIRSTEPYFSSETPLSFRHISMQNIPLQSQQHPHLSVHITCSFISLSLSHLPFSEIFFQPYHFFSHHSTNSVFAPPLSYVLKHHSFSDICIFQLPPLSATSLFNYLLFQGCHLSFTSKFPDFSLIFPWHFTVSTPSDRYFNGANCITSNFGGYSKRKEFAPHGSKFFPLRVAPNEEEDGLILSHENVHPFPPFEHNE